MVEYSVLNRLELRLWFSGCCVISGRPPIALSHLTDHLHCDGGDELDDLFDSLLCEQSLPCQFSPTLLSSLPLSYLWISPLPPLLSISSLHMCKLPRLLKHPSRFPSRPQFQDFEKSNFPVWTGLRILHLHQVQITSSINCRV